MVGCTFEWIFDFLDVVEAEDEGVECFGVVGEEAEEACGCAEAVVVVGERGEGVDVVVEWIRGGVLSVRKMTRILRMEKMLPKRRMSEGG